VICVLLRLARSDALPVGLCDTLRLSFDYNGRNSVSPLRFHTDHLLTRVFIGSFDDLHSTIKTVAVVDFGNVASWYSNRPDLIITHTCIMHILFVICGATCGTRRIPVESTRGTCAPFVFEECYSPDLMSVIRPEHDSRHLVAIVVDLRVLHMACSEHAMVSVTAIVFIVVAEVVPDILSTVPGVDPVIPA